MGGVSATATWCIGMTLARWRAGRAPRDTVLRSRLARLVLSPGFGSGSRVPSLELISMPLTLLLFRSRTFRTVKRPICKRIVDPTSWATSWV